MQDSLESHSLGFAAPREEPPVDGDRKNKKRKKKVEKACVYCRRSHMICDDTRPCLRCIKRGIGHLCHDEPALARQKKKNSEELMPSPPVLGLDLIEKAKPQAVPQAAPVPNVSSNLKTLPINDEPFFYSEHAGSEFSSLNDFLLMIDDPELGGALADTNTDSLMPFSINQQNGMFVNFPNNMNMVQGAVYENRAESPQKQPEIGEPYYEDAKASKPVISDTARDKFFLTAADPTTEISPEERLKQVIKAKLEAGLLQPYNYAKGYARLQSYMDNYMNRSSRQRVLKPLLIFRPAFRAIARTLKDVDLVLVEESFERMLLDYDRVFTSMAIPACLWRRTGEIYRGNKEFASLVGVTTDDLKDGKLAIYELMSEESAVNFWEKYGAIAFDKGQKAVLTSCKLRTKDGFKLKSCCFSFTIRRDRYNIPSCIVGNFIPIDP